MRIQIRSDQLIFCLPDPTCNNGYMKLFPSWTKYKPERTKSSLKLWVIKSNFMPTYLIYKYIFFPFRNKVGSGARSEEKSFGFSSLYLTYNVLNCNLFSNHNQIEISRFSAQLIYSIECKIWKPLSLILNLE